MKKIYDERIEMEKSKLLAAVSGIFCIGIPFDIGYKLFYLNSKSSSWAGELAVYLIAAAFFAVASTKKGLIYLTANKENERKMGYKFLVGNLSLGITYAIADALNGSLDIYPQDKTKNIIFTILGILFFTLIGYLIDITIMKISNRNANKEIE